MSADAIGYRFDTLHEHFSNSELFKGIPINDYKDYIDGLLECEHAGAFWVATPEDFGRKITISKLRNFIRQCELDALIIDGITYLSDERGDNKTTSLTNISEDLMQLSCETKNTYYCCCSS